MFNNLLQVMFASGRVPCHSLSQRERVTIILHARIMHSSITLHRWTTVATSCDWRRSNMAVSVTRWPSAANDAMHRIRSAVISRRPAQRKRLRTTHYAWAGVGWQRFMHSFDQV